MRRLAAAGRRVAEAVAVTWLVSVLLQWVLAGTFAGLGAALFVAGVTGLWLWLLTALLTLVCALLPQRLWVRLEQPAALKESGLWLAGQAVVAALVGGLVAMAVAPLLPNAWAFHTEIARVAGAWLGLGAAAAVAWALWRTRDRERPFVRWTWLPLYLVIRLVTEWDFLAFGQAYRAWLELGGMAVCVAALLGASALPPRVQRVRLGVLVAWPLSVLALVFGVEAWPGAFAAMTRGYPAASKLLWMARSVSDADGDGYPSALGGPDCDDLDPAVHPAALEKVGNQIDDNCFGGDLAAPEIVQTPGRIQGATARSVVIITVDTLRADHLSERHMPRLWAFSGKAARFERAYASAPYTGASLGSFMTGRHPMNLYRGWGQWLGSEPFAAELLRRAGYRTSAVVQIWSQDRKTGRQMRPRVVQGFSEVDMELAAENRGFRARTSQQTTERALKVLAHQQSLPGPFLAWFHYFDPHEQYVPHEGTPFAGDGSSELYAQEVWSTDRHLGRLLEELERSFVPQGGLVFVHSDHGELLGEQGRHGHAYWLAEQTLRVPLVIRGKGVPAGPVTTRVRLLDVYPTMLKLAAGLVVQSDGRDLLPVWSGIERQDRPVFARTTYGDGRVRAGLVGPHKLVQQVVLGAESLYNVESDPEQTDDLRGEQPEVAEAIAVEMGKVWDLSMNDAILKRRGSAVARARCAAGDARACAALKAQPEP